MDDVIRVEGVTKTFHQGGDAIHALKGVDFRCKEGEIKMIVGPSGSGKTTLLSCIAGVLFFEKGEIEVLGHNLHKMKESEITEFRKSHIGFIFQLFNLIPTLNVLENISIPLILNGWNFNKAEEKAADMLAKVGLKGREREFPQKLSGGQQQRVAIARALVHDPMLVICDEPTAALDAETGAHVMELLNTVVKKDKRSAVIVTHDNRIFQYADHIVHMNDGKIENNQQS